jgi:hypothetical protein
MFTNNVNWPSVEVTGGEVRINGSWIGDGFSTASPTIKVSYPASSLVVGGVTVSHGGVDNRDLYIDRTIVQGVGAGSINLNNIVVRGYTTSTAAYTRPIFDFTSHTRGTVSNSVMYGTAGTNPPGTFVKVTDDDWVSIVGNRFMNWKLVLPTNATCSPLPSCFISARLNTGLAAGSSAQRDTSF